MVKDWWREWVVMGGRIALLHAFMDILGGGEYLMLQMAVALRRVNYDLDLYTVTPPPWRDIERIFGIRDPEKLFRRVHVHEELNPFRFGRGRFVRLKRLLAYHGFFKMFNRERLRDMYDLIVDTQSNTASPVDLAYIHYPVIAETYSKKTPLYDAYSVLVKLLYRLWFGKPMSRLIATNSSWTARIIKKYYGVEAHVLHPPVDTSAFQGRCGGPREKIIVTLSRLTPEKNIPAVSVVASMLPGYRYIVMGRPDDRRVYEELVGIPGLEVLTDLPREEVAGILCRAKYYVHPPFREHFGIAVVEAMAAGLVPFVYYDSGSCTDIVSRVDSRLCYKDVSEVPRMIKWIEEKGLWEELSVKAGRAAEMFSVERFYDRVARFFSTLL